MPGLPSYGNTAPSIGTSLGEDLVNNVLGIRVAAGDIEVIVLFVIEDDDVGSFGRNRLRSLCVKNRGIDGKVRGRPGSRGVTREGWDADDRKKNSLECHTLLKS